jgi:hypothetical protein
MNVVRIRGTREQLLGLGRIEGVVLATSSTRPLEGDLWEIAAHATDDGIASVAATGCTVEVDQTAAEHEQLLASLYEDIRPDEGQA